MRLVRISFVSIRVEWLVMRMLCAVRVCCAAADSFQFDQCKCICLFTLAALSPASCGARFVSPFQTERVEFTIMLVAAHAVAHALIFSLNYCHFSNFIFRKLHQLKWVSTSDHENSRRQLEQFEIREHFYHALSNWYYLGIQCDDYRLPNLIEPWEKITFFISLRLANTKHNCDVNTKCIKMDSRAENRILRITLLCI